MTKKRRLRWAGHVACMRNVYRILVGRPEGKRPPRRHRQRWEDNNEMHLRKIELEVWTGGISGKVKWNFGFHKRKFLDSLGDY
jgi:hypothetical protein